MDATDRERVKQEITATRCTYRSVDTGEDAMDWQPDLPDGPQPTTASSLFDLVKAKQMHVCRFGPGGCRHERNSCKYGFTFAPNHAGCVYDEATKR